MNFFLNSKCYIVLHETFFYSFIHFLLFIPLAVAGGLEPSQHPGAKAGSFEIYIS